MKERIRSEMASEPISGTELMLGYVHVGFLPQVPASAGKTELPTIRRSIGVVESVLRR
jgi:hypothetical protein